MTDLPEARVVHATTRRLRLKIADRRRDEAFFGEVEKQLGGWDSIERVEANPLTGSVLVHFTEPAGLFAENALKNRLFAVSYKELTAGADDAASLTEWAAHRVGDADQAVRRWSGGTADIRA